MATDNTRLKGEEPRGETGRAVAVLLVVQMAEGSSGRLAGWFPFFLLSGE